MNYMSNLEEQEEKKMGIMEKLVYLVAIIPSTILSGFVLTRLWSWFFVPTFGLPVLSIAQAIGIALVIGWLTQRFKKVKDDEMWERLYYSVGGTLIIWGIGWIIHQFM